MKRALVVDDKEENLEYLTALFRGHGYDVAAAKHGAEALALARQHPPDLVISDLLMPVMDGYTLLRHWKLDERLARIPFVVYTATYTEPEDEALARKLGADAFILKPVEPDELMARIEGIDHHPPARPTSRTGESGLLREYSETLIRKLEQKSIQLEDANRSLQADIAARKAAEAALRESEASFRQLTELMPQLVWMADAEGRNIFVNRRWVEHTGATSAEARKDGWLASFHPEDRARVTEDWKRALERTSPFSLEARIPTIDGTPRTCLVRAVPMRDEDGRVTRWFGTCTDIQELADAQDRLRRAEEELQHAQKMEAMGRLAGGVAHDFNNLLSVILMYTGILLEDIGEGGRFSEEVAQIQRAGERATALTRQLLAFSRRRPVQPKVLVPGQIVSDMRAMLRRLLGEDIDLALVAPQPFGRVIADSTQLEQIVMNLAVNARDAMPLGGRLVVEVQNVELDAAAAAGRPGSTAGAYVQLGIKDNGTGMDASTRARIFEPFFTTKQPGHGTGLGLSTVFGIVQQSGGTITVDSAPGLGTTFAILLPRTDRTDDEPGLPAPLSEAQRGTETVLLVEDDDQVRQTVRVLLERNGYEVIDARNGGEALLLSEKTRRDIQLLVTDVVMLHMSGPELARRLKQSRPAMRVLYMSGYAENSTAHNTELEGPFLEKPTVPDSFLRKIREVLA